MISLSINATIASGAGAGAPNSSACHSSFETNLSPIEPFVSTETTDNKVDATSFGACVFSRKRLYKNAPKKTEQKDTKTASELDSFSVLSGYHLSTLESPTAQLNNEKRHANEDADNSNEKEIDNVDAQVMKRLFLWP